MIKFGRMFKKKYIWFFVFLLSFVLIIIKSCFLLSRPFADNDEGIYLTTFLLVAKGYKLYKEVFFSQLPGFFLLVYPGFIIFGKTLLAVRLTIFLWSLIGLLAIVWLMKELKKIPLSLIVILLVWLMPKYFNQATIVQSDSLVTCLSVLSLASLLRFKNKNKIFWFFLAVVFFSLATITKLDITVGLILIFILFKQLKKNHNKNWPFFLTILFLIPIIGAVSTGYFGYRSVIDNTIKFRIQAANYYPIAPGLFWQYLTADRWLLSLTIILLIALVVNLFFKKISKNSVLIIFWCLSTVIFIIFFRPIFPHHLSMLTVPLTLSIIMLFSDISKLEKKPKLIFLLIFFLLIMQVITIQKSKNNLTSKEIKLINFIKKNTNKDDFIVTDEAKFYYLTGRLPPPPLSDISFVRVRSGNLNKKNFKEIVDKYKPKLIIRWNERLAF